MADSEHIAPWKWFVLAPIIAWAIAAAYFTIESLIDPADGGPSCEEITELNNDCDGPEPFDPRGF